MQNATTGDMCSSVPLHNNIVEKRCMIYTHLYEWANKQTPTDIGKSEPMEISTGAKKNKNPLIKVVCQNVRETHRLRMCVLVVFFYTRDDLSFKTEHNDNTHKTFGMFIMEVNVRNLNE